jgi:ATP-binding cassette subfamily F protein 3
VPAYFSQHEVELDETGSVLDCAQKSTALKRPQAQNLLGRFLFSGWQEQDKAVVKLSGGERRRLALALVVASGANFLLLDEPTNHLDLESREALELALEAFPGTVLLVSHDRALLDAVAQRTLAVEDGTIRSYDGGWADYVRRRDEVATPIVAVSEPKARPTPKPVAPKQTGPNELERIEAEIASHERAVAELEERLAKDWADAEAVAAHRTARDELQALLARWEQLFEQAKA